MLFTIIADVAETVVVEIFMPVTVTLQEVIPVHKLKPHVIVVVTQGTQQRNVK